MHDRPDRTELLAAARETLLADVLPRLEGPPRYACLMVASAIAIAVRELEGGHEPARRVLDGYAGLYGQDNVHDAGADGPSRIAALNRHLARDLRDGAFDDALLGPVHGVLLEQAVQRLRLSNPKFLEASEYSQPSAS